MQPEAVCAPVWLDDAAAGSARRGCSPSASCAVRRMAITVAVPRAGLPPSNGVENGHPVGVHRREAVGLSGTNVTASRLRSPRCPGRVG